MSDIEEGKRLLQQVKDELEVRRRHHQYALNDVVAAAIADGFVPTVWQVPWPAGWLPPAMGCYDTLIDVRVGRPQYQAIMKVEAKLAEAKLAEAEQAKEKAQG